jgi:CubicO group peptidase (beta-lactamase class C family)
MTKAFAAITLALGLTPSTCGSIAAELPVRGANPGFIPAELKAVDALVLEWMNATGTPGLSIALSVEGRLVLARGYGYADVERREPVEPKHRFRIASISKPVTAVAVAKIIEQGELAWNSKVFGRYGMLGTRYGSQPYHQWLNELNVEHLLMHTSGAWGNSHNDPMFLNKNWPLTRLIDDTLDTYPHNAAPGSRYDYSNFGYALLGRIVERRTGLSYENYVQRQVLAPMGIYQMAIGGNTLRDRQQDEVRYYPAAPSYGMNVERMDAHGGWIATARDLLRFLSRVDGFDAVPDQLRPVLKQRLFTPSAANRNYARGWSVNSRPNYWHAGSMPGTSSILVRTHDGFGWAALANSRPADMAARDNLNQLMWDIKRQFSYWPPGSLF